MMHSAVADGAATFLQNVADALSDAAAHVTAAGTTVEERLEQGLEVPPGPPIPWPYLHATDTPFAGTVQTYVCHSGWFELV